MEHKTKQPTNRPKDEGADLLDAPGLESLSKLTSDLLKAPKPIEVKSEKPKRKLQHN